MKSKKSKLLLSLCTLMFCIGVMCFGVYAATSVSYTLSGHITYEVNDVFVDIDTTLYASKKDLYTSQSNIAEDMHSISSALESGTSVPTTNLVVFPYSDHQSSLNNVGEGETSYVAKALDLNYGSYVADTASYAYYVAITISNYAEETISTTLDLDSLYDLNTNVIISPERTMENIPAGTSDSPSKVCLVFGLTLDNPAQSIDVSFEGVKLSVNKGELQETPGLSFTAIDNGEAYSVSSGTADAERLVIPAYHEGKPVTTIANMSGSQFKSVYIPNTIDEINASAFNNSALRDIVFQDGSPITVLNGNVFSNCSNLVSINLSNLPELKTLDNCRGGDPSAGVFYNCQNLISISLPEGLTEIDTGGFNGCSRLISVALPNSVETIEAQTFSGCKSLQILELPSSLINLGGRVCSGCDSLRVLTVDPANTKYKSDGNCIIEIESKTLVLGCGGSIIPTDDTVTSIGNIAFYGSTISSIEIPNNILTIGQSAFSYCDKLVSVSILDGVSSIEYGAFSSCTNLSEVELGNGITEIGSGIFVGTNWLTQLPTNHPDGIVASTDRTVKYAIKASTDIESVDLSGVKLIFDSAYENCTNLTSITIPESVTYIGSRAFAGCTNAVVTFEDTVNTTWHVVPHSGPTGPVFEKDIDVTQPFDTWKNYWLDIWNYYYSWEKKISA